MSWLNFNRKRQPDRPQATISLLDDFLLPGLVAVILTQALRLVVALQWPQVKVVGQFLYSINGLNSLQLCMFFICFRFFSSLPLFLFFRPLAPRRIALAACAGLMLMAALVLIGSEAARLLRLPPAEFAWFRAFSGLDSGRLLRLTLSLAIGSALAPLVEELYFRAILFGWMRQRWKFAPSMVLSASIFALFHGKWLDHPDFWGLYYSLAIMASGMVMAALYHRYGTLWASIAMHATYNMTGLLLSHSA